MTHDTEHSRKNLPVDIKELLAKVIDRRKWRQRLQLHRTFQLWSEVVGPDIGARAQPVFIRGRTLWVEVTDSIWMQQLHLQKMLLLELLNSKLEGPTLADIRFALNPELNKGAGIIPHRKATRPVDLEKLAAFEKDLAMVQDEGIKEALRRLWKKQHTNP
jgi:hypothetical protein